MQHSKKARKKYIIGFFLAAGIFCLINAITHNYPFGTVNNLVDDEYLQYVDFFCYLKNVLNGTARLDYSMGKSLGGNTVALVGYYLTSPFNLLVGLFDHSTMPMCIFLITTLKVSLASVTAIFFLSRRFPKLEDRYAVLLGLCYALSAYSIGQSDNIMWLDGVYMLPLLMYAVYDIVQQERYAKLSLLVGYTIFANWYTGYMNCLFIPFYYCVEMLLFRCSQAPAARKTTKAQVFAFLKFCGYELLGVALSAALFFPVVYCLLQGKGAMEEGILRFNTGYPFLELIGAWMVGNQRIWIYCSLFVLLLVCCFFAAKHIPKAQKICVGALLLFSVSIVYFTPMENIFNGFRFAYSFQYRSAYIPILMCIYAAAAFSASGMEDEIGVLAKAAGGIVFAFLLYEFVAGTNTLYMFCSIAAVCAYGALIGQAARNTRKGTVCFALIACVLLSELSLTGKKQLQSSPNYEPDAAQYAATQALEETLTEQLKASDSSSYRINTARTVSIAKPNSGMAYHYPTISHYDSGYDKNVAQFLKRIGYSSVEAVSLVDEPILPADTLLGVKYLFTNSTDNKSFLGFQPVAGLENEKFRVLENTYALPMAFAVGTCPAESLLAEDNSNPFELMNAIYSELLGYDAALFKKVDTTAAFTDDGIVFSTPITDGALYGYTFQELWLRTSLYIDERLDREYGGWLYQPVYYIGNGETAHTVRLKDYTRPGNEDGTAVYALDMDAFTKAVEALRAGTPDVLEVKDGYISATISTAEPQSLFISVPADKGWSANLNGEPVEIQTAGGIFMKIDLPAGESQIVLKFTAPWLHAGIAVSIAAAAVLVLLWTAEKGNRQAAFRRKPKKP